MNEEHLLQLNEEQLKELVQALPRQRLYGIIAKLLSYEEVPPEITDFVHHSDFLGDIVGKEIYPVWDAALRKVFPNPFTSPVVEIAVTGAIGIGKTTVAKIGALYDIYKLICLKSPQEFYGLIKTTEIVCQLLSATLTLTNDVIVNEMIDWVEASREFRKWLNDNTTKGAPLFKKNIDIHAGSRSSHALGQATFVAILDELNFQSGLKNQAWDNYTAVKRRMQSRFLKDGRLPGHLYLISSKKDENSMLETYIANVKKNNFKDTLVLDYPIWEVKPDKYSKDKFFFVYAGDEYRDPFIIEDYKTQVHYDLDESRLIKVPIDCLQDFQMNIYEALRDLAGVFIRGFAKFIPSKEKIIKAQQLNNPVLQEPVKIYGGVRENTDFNLLNYFDQEKLRRNANLTKFPVYLHFDFGLKGDRMGVAATRIFDFIVNKKIDETTGKEIKVHEPVFLTEFVAFVEAQPGAEVPLFRMKEFVKALSASGFPVAGVSADGWQSVIFIQDLEALGYTAKVISVDRTKEPYKLLKALLYEDRLILPKSELLQRELLDLYDTGKKIDHPPESSKDGADAVCGSLWFAYETAKSYLMQPVSLEGVKQRETIEWV